MRRSPATHPRTEIRSSTVFCNQEGLHAAQQRSCEYLNVQSESLVMPVPPAFEHLGLVIRRKRAHAAPATISAANRSPMLGAPTNQKQLHDPHLLSRPETRSHFRFASLARAHSLGALLDQYGSMVARTAHRAVVANDQTIASGHFLVRSWAQRLVERNPPHSQPRPPNHQHFLPVYVPEKVHWVAISGPILSGIRAKGV